MSKTDGKNYIRNRKFDELVGINEDLIVIIHDLEDYDLITKAEFKKLDTIQSKLDKLILALEDKYNND